MENCKISRERVFAQTPLWAKRKTSWAIETAAFCCIVGFPFGQATSLGEIALGPFVYVLLFTYCTRTGSDYKNCELLAKILHTNRKK